MNPSPTLFTPRQLVAVLEFMPWPVAILDPEGQLWVQNHFWQEPSDLVRECHPLEDGWSLVRYMPPQEENFEDANPADKVRLLTRGLTHELRNPLSAILTAIELLQDVAELGEENSMLLEVVRKESRRLGRILNEFSAYARPALATPSTFDLAVMVRRAARRCHDLCHVAKDAAPGPETEQSGAGQGDRQPIKIHDALTAQIWVRADEALVDDALERVFRNACEAMRDRSGTLSLSSESTEEDGAKFVVLCVEDSGPGFSVESLRRAFEPFFSTKAQEAGLGLPIARSALEATGGKLWVEQPHPDSGARVCLRLPAAAPLME